MKIAITGNWMLDTSVTRHMDNAQTAKVAILSEKPDMVIFAGNYHRSGTPDICHLKDLAEKAHLVYVCGKHDRPKRVRKALEPLGNDVIGFSRLMHIEGVNILAIPHLHDMNALDKASEYEATGTLISQMANSASDLVHHPRILIGHGIPFDINATDEFSWGAWGDEDYDAVIVGGSNSPMITWNRTLCPGGLESIRVSGKMEERGYWIYDVDVDGGPKFVALELLQSGAKDAIETLYG